MDRSEYQEGRRIPVSDPAFLNFSEAAARESGLESQQHQALLALKGMPQGSPPTIGHLAERLLLKHHSAVGLIDRMQTLGLVSRQPNPDDARQVLVQLTPKGERLLHSLSVAHRRSWRKQDRNWLPHFAPSAENQHTMKRTEPEDNEQSIAPPDELGDFTADSRLIPISFAAIAIGSSRASSRSRC